MVFDQRAVALGQSQRLEAGDGTGELGLARGSVGQPGARHHDHQHQHDARGHPDQQDRRATTAGSAGLALYIGIAAKMRVDEVNEVLTGVTGRLRRR